MSIIITLICYNTSHKRDGSASQYIRDPSQILFTVNSGVEEQQSIRNMRTYNMQEITAEDKIFLSLLSPYRF